jgi:hypothetical protein
MKTLSLAAGLTLGLLLLVSPLHAQTTTASLSGRVLDSTGAAMPGASVTITSPSTGVTVWSGVTDPQGLYVAPSLPVGTYDVEAAFPGFRTVTVKGVRLTVDQRARVDLPLSPGDVQETLVVTGETSGELESQSSSMGLVVNTAQVQNLPLASRAILNLLSLVGGVSAGGPSTGLNSAQLSINGSRTLNSEFTVDGVSMVSGSTGGLVRLPSTEALREFRVLTASYSAEYGRSAGGFVNVVVHSGANDYHGGVYEYFRHEKLNANDFFRKLRGDARPTDRYNQFGAKIGGPLRVPGLYDGHERTFFFVNYEGLRRQQPSTAISTIPDMAFRTGDFSASTVPVIDPLTGQQFPGNRIPAGRIDPAAAKIMGLLPQPNSPGTADTPNGRRVSNYVADQTVVPTEDEVTARIDHNAGTATRLFGRFTYYRIKQPLFSTIPGALDPAVGPGNTPGYQVSLGWTQTWSSRLLMDVNLGYMRDNQQFDPPSAGLDVPGVLGIQRSAYPAAPRLNISGYAGLGINENTLRRQLNNNYQGALGLIWVRNSHVFKTGAQLRFNQFEVFNPGADFTGNYNFNGEITSPNKAGGNPVNALADFLLGRIQTVAYEIPQESTGRRNHNLGLYVQDDWRVNSKLTLNLGLRYEYESAVSVDNDTYSRLDLATGRLLVAGRNASRTLDLDADKLNFAPRVGFAYAIDEKTIVRSAAGLFYGQVFSNLGGVVRYPGFTARTSFADLGVGIPQPFRLSEGHPLTASPGAGDPFAAERSATAANPLSGAAQYGTVSPLPYSLQWNFGIQRELFRGTIVDLSYVGSRGYHLPLSRGYNQVPYERALEVAQAGNTLFTQNARPVPTVNGFGAFVHEGSSIYHSLQARASRQFSKRFGFQASYTWSKSIDDGSGIFNFSQPNGLDGGQFENQTQFKDLNRAVSAFDRPHIFAASVQYTTGGPWWTRGIQSNVIVRARSGLPDTITQSNLHPLAGQQRPGIVGNNTGGYAPGRTQEGTGIRYLLPTNDRDFPFVPVGPLFVGSGASRRLVLPYTEPGNLGRNTMREPSEFTVDLALARRFTLKGSAGFTLRAEAFNLLNRVNLNAPNTALSVIADATTGLPVFNSPNFGLITSAKPARFVQLVGRFDF